MADYIYPVNDQSDSWWGPGRDRGPRVKHYFRTAARAKRWGLANCFRLIVTGDRIWAYATAPLQQIVGVGYVVKAPYREWSDGSSGYLIDIEWDLARNKKLVNIGPAKLFDRHSVPQTVRRAKEHEVKIFMRAYDKAGK